MGAGSGGFWGDGGLSGQKGDGGGGKRLKGGAVKRETGEGKWKRVGFKRTA